MIFQFVIIFWLNSFFQCYAYHGLTIQQWGLCLLIAFTVIPFSFLLRILPCYRPEPIEEVKEKSLELQFRDAEDDDERSGEVY